MIHNTLTDAFLSGRIIFIYFYKVVHCERIRNKISKERKNVIESNEKCRQNSSGKIKAALNCLACYILPPVFILHYNKALHINLPLSTIIQLSMSQSMTVSSSEPYINLRPKFHN